MVRVTPEELERRRRAQFGRTIMGVSALLLMIMSAVLPHIMVEAATVLPGRSLFPASRFFLIANPNAEAFQSGSFAPMRVWGSALLSRPGISSGGSDHRRYIVLGAHRRGCRTLDPAPGDGLWCITLLGASTVVFGYQLLSNAGIPGTARLRWIPTLLAGVIMVVGGRLARKRLVSTWYWKIRKSCSPKCA